MFTALLLATTVTLTATPRVVAWSPGKPTVITLHLVIENATEKEWCPEIQWEWPDGTKSTEESDCDPFDDADPKAIARQSWTKRVIVGPGELTFTVRLVKSDKTIKVLEAKVKVVGG